MSAPTHNGPTRAETERSALAPTLEFLWRHAPFDRMAGAHLEFLARRLRLGFYFRNEIITDPRHGSAASFSLLKRGRVRAELAQRSREVWEREPGECFPIGAMLARRPTAMRYRAGEDTFCFELDRERFDKLLALSPCSATSAPGSMRTRVATGGDARGGDARTRKVAVTEGEHASRRATQSTMQVNSE